MESLKKQLKNCKEAEELALEYKMKYDSFYANAWLNFNWEDILGKKPTIRDKEQWIINNYMKDYEKMKKAQIESNYQKELFDLMKMEDGVNDK